MDVNLTAARKEGAAATRALLDGLKIKPGVASLPVRYTNPDESVVLEELKQLDDAAKFAAEIDCPRMMAVLPPSSQTPKAEFRKVIKDRVTSIAGILARSNVRLGLEFLGPLHFRTRNPHEFIWRMDEALAFAKECGPNVGLTLDAWHWHHAGATAADILAAGKARIVHVHVSDARQQPPEEVRDNQRVFPGEGVIDLTTFFQIAAEDRLRRRRQSRADRSCTSGNDGRGGSAARPRDDAGGHAKGLKRGQLSVPFSLC